MNFGDAWKDWMGECDQSQSEKMLDYFYDQGGNFVDTANGYQGEQSEQWIGEWMMKRGNRDQIVLATKYTACFRRGHDDETLVNFAGNGAKSLHTSINASLRKLQTDYIDLLYVHWWEFSTSIPELMQSLNKLVSTGKVLYLGISDTPAWVVTKANQYARDHGLAQFSVYQGRWSAAHRDLERDIVHMCRDEDMAIAPWGSLGGGNFKTEEQRKASTGRKIPPNETEINISEVLERIAIRKNTLITSVAQAYVTHKAPFVFPIVGGRSVDHLKANIEALSLKLTDEDMQEIDNVAKLDLGFPLNMLWGDKVPDHPGKVFMLFQAGTYDHVPLAKPIAPAHQG
ncbi:hypothetical protein CaCOL14_004670 [Colletotrichum acutatum]